MGIDADSSFHPQFYLRFDGVPFVCSLAQTTYCINVLSYFKFPASYLSIDIERSRKGRGKVLQNVWASSVHGNIAVKTRHERLAGKRLSYYVLLKSKNVGYQPASQPEIGLITDVLLLCFRCQ